MAKMRADASRWADIPPKVKMTKEEYERQKNSIENDTRYPASLKEWMLQELNRIYEESAQQSVERTGEESG